MIQWQAFRCHAKHIALYYRLLYYFLENYIKIYEQIAILIFMVTYITENISSSKDKTRPQIQENSQKDIVHFYRPKLKVNSKGWSKDLYSHRSRCHYSRGEEHENTTHYGDRSPDLRFPHPPSSWRFRQWPRVGEILPLVASMGVLARKMFCGIGKDISSKVSSGMPSMFRS
jgi:hypothetical protein